MALTRPWYLFLETKCLTSYEYASESAKGFHCNKLLIKIPFVLGATIELGNCLHLLETESINEFKDAYASLVQVVEKSGEPMPVD